MAHLIVFCVLQPWVLLALAALCAHTSLFLCYYYRQSRSSKAAIHETVTTRAACCICGRRRGQFRRWRLLPWVPLVSVVLNVSLSTGTNLSSTRFIGGVLDTGAAMSCVGYSQARAHCNMTGT